MSMRLVLEPVSKRLGIDKNLRTDPDEARLNAILVTLTDQIMHVVGRERRVFVGKLPDRA